MNEEPWAQIILIEEEDWWVAKDEEAGVISQGRTREAVLENLDESLDGFLRVGEAPTDEQLREADIDLEQTVSSNFDDSEIFE